MKLQRLKLLSEGNVRIQVFHDYPPHSFWRTLLSRHIAWDKSHTYRAHPEDYKASDDIPSIIHIGAFDAT